MLIETLVGYLHTESGKLYSSFKNNDYKIANNDRVSKDLYIKAILASDMIQSETSQKAIFMISKLLLKQESKNLTYDDLNMLKNIAEKEANQS